MEEKRKFPRFPVTASVICSRYGRQMTMRTLDISQGGLKLEANFDLTVGESMDLTILIEGTRVRCKGKILALEELNHTVQARLCFAHPLDFDFRKLKGISFEKSIIGGMLILSAYIAYLIIRAYFFQ